MTTISTNGNYIYEEYDEDWSDEDYEYEDDPDEEYLCIEEYCTDYAVDECQCCGKPLCVMHSEIGAGFCRECPTKEWIEQQQDIAAERLENW